MSTSTVSQAGNITTFPPLVDCHVHFREPGLEAKADMVSESEAAFFGGIGAVCDMPNTNPPTQTVATFADKVERSKRCSDKCLLYFFFGATKDEHLKELEQLWCDPQHAALKSHCSGLKLYLDNSTGDLKSSKSVTESAFELCGRLRIPLVAHCEQSDINNKASEETPYTDVSTHSVRRPAESEVSSIAEAVEMGLKYNTPLHIAHLSTEGGLNIVRETRRQHPNFHLTCEVAPHHLFLTTEDYTCCGARVKVNPPVRPKKHHEALWAGVLDGTVDCIGTDHAPHLLSEKDNKENPPSGMPAIEVVVPLLLSVVAGRWPHPTAPCPAALKDAAKKLTLNRIAELMHTNPVKIFGLRVDGLKSRQFDLSREWEVVEQELHSKCKWSPYNGWKLLGKAV
ncbi:dihydroorotase [Angomonas deanei]|uniref:Amidohydrolase family, putative n=1 Tax=Angomonas deanei TaxID=59799 RepID=S9VBP1_9TRYP|nr:dihydroorotase [Angomonas deanei]EPY34076.1 dihydroorotase [Angomonas deanei]EPY38409.1 dihydroorotase [Angomonas deanei]CAD2212695.1 Amidohydrolase family, putative [Angomonas deanei]|eukprot:EPY25768.1 dihydroorotase [Angomonas deanei]